MLDFGDILDFNGIDEFKDIIDLNNSMVLN